MPDARSSFSFGKQYTIFLGSSNNWPTSVSMFQLQMTPLVNLKNNFQLFFFQRVFCSAGLQWSHLRGRGRYAFTSLSWRSRTHRHTKILCAPVCTEIYAPRRPTYIASRNKTFSSLSRSCLPINAERKQRWNQLTEIRSNRKESIVCLYWSITFLLYLFFWLLYLFHNSSFRTCSPTLSTLSFSVIVSLIIFNVYVYVKERVISQTKWVGERTLISLTEKEIKHCSLKQHEPSS